MTIPCPRVSLQFDLLEQLGFEGYSMIINTSELQSHLLATTKGRNFHKMRQQVGKPLENPFVGFIFSDEAGMSFSVVMAVMVVWAYHYRTAITVLWVMVKVVFIGSLFLLCYFVICFNRTTKPFTSFCYRYSV